MSVLMIRGNAEGSTEKEYCVFSTDSNKLRVSFINRDTEMMTMIQNKGLSYSNAWHSLWSEDAGCTPDQILTQVFGSFTNGLINIWRSMSMSMSWVHEANWKDAGLWIPTNKPCRHPWRSMHAGGTLFFQLQQLLLRVVAYVASGSVALGTRRRV